MDRNAVNNKDLIPISIIQQREKGSFASLESHSGKLKNIMEMEKSLRSERKFKNAQELYTNYLNNIMKPTESHKEYWEEIALAFNNRGQLKYLAVDFDGAVEDYDEAIKYNSTLASAFYNRGTISYRMGYFEKALADLEKAVELSPDPEFILARDRCKLEIDSNSNSK